MKISGRSVLVFLFFASLIPLIFVLIGRKDMKRWAMDSSSVVAEAPTQAEVQSPIQVATMLEITIVTNTIVHDKGGSVSMMPATSRPPVFVPDPGLPRK